MITTRAQWVVASSATSGSSNLIGGTELLQLLVLALGGALVVGNGLALVRSRRPVTAGSPGPDADAVTPPLGRSMFMIVIGLVAVIWAVASLTA